MGKGKKNKQAPLIKAIVAALAVHAAPAKAAKFVLATATPDALAALAALQHENASLKGQLSAAKKATVPPTEEQKLRNHWNTWLSQKQAIYMRLKMYEADKITLTTRETITVRWSFNDTSTTACWS